MGFSSVTDFVAKALQGGKQFYTDWRVANGATVGTAGRWYDGSTFNTVPLANVWGELVKNGTPSSTGSSAYWTYGANWTLGAGYTVHAVGSTSSISQTIPIFNGRTYRTVYTIASYSGSGNIVLSLGGTAGTNRAANGTYTENIVCGAGATVNIQAATTAGCRISAVSVIQELGFTIYDDTMSTSARYHGGNVAPETKHILDVSVNGTAATLAGSCFMLVDVLGCYPRIDANSNALQTLDNSSAITRYTTGDGVRAFLVTTTALGTTAANISYSYTNQAGTTGKSQPFQVNIVASSGVGHITNSETAAASYYYPFLPLCTDCYGVRSFQSIRLSVATGTAGAQFALVLCRPLLVVPVLAINMYNERDFITTLPSLPRVYDGAYLSWIFSSGGAMVASAAALGYIRTCWG